MYKLFHMDLKIINYSLSPLPLLSFALIIMKEVYSIESKEKKIFQYLFFELWLIVFTIYQKCTDEKNVVQKWLNLHERWVLL